MKRTMVQAARVAAAAVLGLWGARALAAGMNSTITGKVALLLPEAKTTRYETADRPDFEAAMRALAPKVEVIYSNADQDAARWGR